MPKKKKEKPVKRAAEELELFEPIAKRTGWKKLWERATIALSVKERLLFTKYFSVLLNSGVAIDEALSILLQRAKGPLKKVLSTLYNTVREGNTLASGFEFYPWIFDTVFVNLVRAGEESGTLVKSLDQLLIQMLKDIELKKKVQGAMLYPSMILLAAIVISTGIVMFVVPNVVGIFSSLDAELPFATKVLLWISDLLQHQGLLILGGVILFGAFLYGMKKVAFVKPVTHYVLLKLPLIGNIIQKVNLARIMRLLGTLLKSGITIDEAIPITITVVNNVRYKNMLISVLEQVGHGTGFSESLSKYTMLVPSIPMQIISVGEETGALDDMLLYLADFYDTEVSDVMRTMTTLLEPMLMIFIGLVVGGIALAILTPIYSIVGQI